ncbi:MAG TPA: PhaM family polyhydroxyalkanoate granule multifunctional regulatory protein [Burkholderiales bacterium]|jgi:hypothetical protein|nr:PhaM family polyhydroxyalkanoate granule multifunctional regulatory protein [Burkholderiales bacterium]
MADFQSPQDPFEMFRRLWGPLGIPLPGMTMPTLDPAEIEKRIAELKAVEGWLSMNLNMLRMAIQGLEMQKAALEAMRATAQVGLDAASAGAQQPNPMLWPWAAVQQALGGGAPGEEAQPPGSEKGKPDKGRK